VTRLVWHKVLKRLYKKVSSSH